MTVTFGWWALPLLITTASVGWSIAIPGEPSHGDYSFPDPMPAIGFVGAVIVSLVAWLIWALVA